MQNYFLKRQTCGKGLTFYVKFSTCSCVDEETMLARRGKKELNGEEFSDAIIPALMHRIPSELRSQACLGESSTRMGDPLGSPRVAPLSFYFSLHTIESPRVPSIGSVLLLSFFAVSNFAQNYFLKRQTCGKGLTFYVNFSTCFLRR